jgi:CBS domain-containing protein
MLVREVMTRGVEGVRPDDTIQDAAQKMKDLDVGPLPVCDGERVVGMVTDRDITVRAVSDGLDPWTSKVREVMTPDVIFCFEDQDVNDAAKLMKERQVRRLVVLNRDSRMVGILSLGDIAVDSGDKHMAGGTLKSVSEPAKPNR